MLLSSRFYLSVITIILPLMASSCAMKRSHVLATTLPATGSTVITFDERQVPAQCRVFAHLIISIPAGLLESEIKTSVEHYGMDNGADYVLVGMTRESRSEPDMLLFSTYGPTQPYSFKNRWLGWKYGFKDWNSGGPLIDYGHNRMSGDKPAFDVPVDALAILLTCQVGPQNR